MILLFWILFWLHFPILLFWALVGLLMHWLGDRLGNKALKTYGIAIAIGCDQLGNGFAAGFPDETISSRLGRALVSGRPKLIAKVLSRIVNAIFFWEENHVVEAIEHAENFDRRYEPWPWSEWTKEELEAKDKVA